MTVVLKDRLMQLGPGGQLLRIRYDPAVVSPEYVESFGRLLQDMASSGTRFDGGQTMQAGWSVVRFEVAGDGVLEFREPDFRSMPVKWVPGLSTTLMHMGMQKEIVESVLPVEELTIPGMRQSCVTCSRIGTEPGFYMDRSEPRGEDSGWFFGCLKKDHDHHARANLMSMSLYEAVVRRVRAALPFLAMPAGSLVLLDLGRRSVSRYDLELEPKPGSLLSRMPP
jgi:hypothetical protein